MRKLPFLRVAHKARRAMKEAAADERDHDAHVQAWRQYWQRQFRDIVNRNRRSKFTGTNPW